MTWLNRQKLGSGKRPNIKFPDNTDYDFTYDDGGRLELVGDSAGPASDFTYELDGALDTLEHDMTGKGEDVKDYFNFDKVNQKLSPRFFDLRAMIKSHSLCIGLGKI